MKTIQSVQYTENRMCEVAMGVTKPPVTRGGAIISGTSLLLNLELSSSKCFRVSYRSVVMLLRGIGNIGQYMS